MDTRYAVCEPLAGSKVPVDHGSIRGQHVVFRHAARAARRAILAGCLACAIVGTAAAAPASALTRYTVICQTATIFAGPETRTSVGTLYWQQTFDGSDSREKNRRVYGFAFGSVNQWGWISNDCLGL